MENNENNICVFTFVKEKQEISLNLDSPNFSEFVKEILENNYDISEENITVSCDDNSEIDTEALKTMLINIHDDYKEELETFFTNITNDISTYADESGISEKLNTYLTEEGVLSNLTPEEFAALENSEEETNIEDDLDL